MRTWLSNLRPTPWLAQKLFLAAILLGVGVTAFFMGRRQQAGATPPSAAANIDVTEMQRRPVAYIYQDIPIMRAELGEYLIARFGGERLEFLINRKIVELECQKHGIQITDQEVQYRLQQDLRSFGPHITENDFVNNILRRFGKTLYEWKEDVIRPKLMMEKLVRPKIKITDTDIQEGFDARYGPKVECRMIVMAPGDFKTVQDVWTAAKAGRESFLKAASEQQFIASLGQSGGKVPPIHKHFGDKKIEQIAFSLKAGEVSPVIEMPDNSRVILLCERHIPADTTVSLEAKRMELSKEMFELRLAQRIPEEFNELRKKAAPTALLSNNNPHAALPPISGTPVQQTSVQMPASEIPPLVPTPVKVEGMTPLSVRSQGSPSPSTILPPPPTPILPPPPNVSVPPLPSEKK